MLPFPLSVCSCFVSSISNSRTFKIVLEDVDSVRDPALVRDRSLLGAYSLFRSIFCKVSNVQHLSVISMPALFSRLWPMWRMRTSILEPGVTAL